MNGKLKGKLSGELIALLALLVVSAAAGAAQRVRWPVQDGGNGHFYEPVWTPAGIKWHDANAAATAADGYLATITSAAENQIVFGLISDDTRFWWPDPNPMLWGPWLGGRQPPGAPEPDGGWEWVTGEPFDYTRWAPGEPNEFANNGEDYLGYVYHTHIPKAPTWNDSPSWWTKPGYIVEYLPEVVLIQAVSATYASSSFTPSGGAYGRGHLTASDIVDVVVERASGQTTHEDGSFTMTAALFWDHSLGGLASGEFRGGGLSVRDSGANELLTGDLIRLNLNEIVDGSGMLAGEGLFTVTGGELAGDFDEPLGEIVQITFHLDPGGIDDFSGAFTGFSNITLSPIPEPASVALLLIGLPLLLRRRGRRKAKSAEGGIRRRRK